MTHWTRVYPSSRRIGVDPTSNPDPLTGGLLIDVATTQLGTFTIPLRVIPFGIDAADTYENDPQGDVTVGANTITFNTEGYYELAVNFAVISYDLASTLILSLLPVGQAILTFPACISNIGEMSDITVFPNCPFAPLWATMLSAAITVKIEGAVRVYSIFLEASGVAGQNVIPQVTSGFSITKIAGL